MIAKPEGDHLTITSPDSRGRFHLKRFLGGLPDQQYRVYVDQENGRLLLERI